GSVCCFFSCACEIIGMPLNVGPSNNAVAKKVPFFTMTLQSFQHLRLFYHPKRSNTIVRFRAPTAWVRGPDDGWRCYDRARGRFFSSLSRQAPACRSVYGYLAVLLIAHRGASGHAPENTLAAF